MQSIRIAVRSSVLICVMLMQTLVAAEAKLSDKKSWVEYTSFEYRGEDPASENVGDGKFLNPILAGFYPDPSICRAGEDYYLVNSSFSYFPGVPIFRSRDLVNWTQIGHVLSRPSQLKLDGLGVSDGIYAPSISYHGGAFFMITTLVGGGGNLFVTAHDPAGPWSDPVWLNEVDGIDPSFFFDEDGNAYIVHNGPPPENKSLYSGHRAIWIHQIDLSTSKLVAGTSKILVNGGTDISKKPSWIEGPHLFKRNGKYYLIAAEGGTAEGHSQVVFRSDSRDGPFAPFENNPILTQRDLDSSRPDPITSVGHCDFVETQNGEWWSVFLGCRPYERGLYNIGRETFLLPIHWENDWPIITRPGQAVPRVSKRPNLPPQPPAPRPRHGSFVARDDFDGPKLSNDWMFLRTPAQDWFSLTDRPGSLLIAPRKIDLSSSKNPSFIARRQQHLDFSATATLKINPTTQACDAGIAAFQNEDHYFFLGIKIADGSAKQIFVERFAAAKPNRSTMIPPGAKDDKFPIFIAESKLNVAENIELKIEGRGRTYSFYYRAGEDNWVCLLADADGSILSTRYAGGFVGTTIGMFARTTD